MSKCESNPTIIACVIIVIPPGTLPLVGAFLVGAQGRAAGEGQAAALALDEQRGWRWLSAGADYALVGHHARSGLEGLAARLAHMPPAWVPFVGGIGWTRTSLSGGCCWWRRGWWGWTRGARLDAALVVRHVGGGVEGPAAGVAHVGTPTLGRSGAPPRALGGTLVTLQASEVEEEPPAEGAGVCGAVGA